MGIRARRPRLDPQASGIAGLDRDRPRHGDPAVSVLRPAAADAACPNSLSSAYGLRQQPLHTDGAHLGTPPDIVVLIATGPRPVHGGAAVIHIRGGGISAEGVRHGMFLVRNGRVSFYTPALSRGRYRYDPGCMTPCDARARCDLGSGRLKLPAVILAQAA